MPAFDQGSVHPSNLKVRRPGKGQTAESLAAAGFVLPSNLVLPESTHAPVRMHARVCEFQNMVGRGRTVRQSLCLSGFHAVQPFQIRLTLGWTGG